MIWISALLQITMLFDGESAVPEPPPVEQPPPAAVALAGVASWYWWREGEAAAGPALRELLGPDWRGRKVALVRPGKEALIVTLTDWCECLRGDPRERVIDLDVRTFAKLAPASRGLVKVEIAIP